MIGLIFSAEKFQIGAGLSGYIAELGSVLLAADLGLAIEPRDDHAAYIASWLTKLKNDRRLVFQMAAHAERAVTFLHGLQPMAGKVSNEDVEGRRAV